MQITVILVLRFSALRGQVSLDWACRCLFLAACFCVASPARAQYISPDTAAVVVLSEPMAAQALGSLRVAAHSEAEYRALWLRAWAPYDVAPKMPVVDFARFDVIVASLGELPNGSGGIAVLSSHEDAYARTVVILVEFAEIGCMVPTGHHSPAVFVRVPKSSRPTVFVDDVRIQQCY